MTGNPTFLTLQTDVQTIATDLVAYKVLDDAATDRGGQAVLKRDIAREAPY